jgi:hypothetical protein
LIDTVASFTVRVSQYVCDRQCFCSSLAPQTITRALPRAVMKTRRLEARADAAAENMATRRTQGHIPAVVLTSFSGCVHILPGPSENTVSALVHPNLYLNTGYIISCLTVGPEPYLRSHTINRHNLQSTLQQRVRSLQHHTPDLQCPSQLLQHPERIYPGTSDRSQLHLPFPSSVQMPSPSLSVCLRRSNLKRSQSGAREASMPLTVHVRAGSAGNVGPPGHTQGMARTERRLHHAR